ncbi:MAG: WbqC family protein [Saprospiraceae bacterium]
MPTVLSELHFLPSVAMMQHYKTADTLLLEGSEHYQKGSYRNRCHIAGANGVQRLSIPLVKGKNSQQPIGEVRLSFEEPWPTRHWQSIRSAYGSAPFFVFYADAFEPLFRHPPVLLWDFNLQFLTLCFRLLRWEKTIHTTTTYSPAAPQGIQDVRNQIRPSLEIDTPYYPQVFEDRHGFLPNLSILDLLFCMGPEAGGYL